MCFFLEASYLVPNHKTQSYIKTTLYSLWNRLEGRLSYSQSQQLPYLILRKIQTQALRMDRDGEREADTSQPGELHPSGRTCPPPHANLSGASRSSLLPSPAASRWGQKCPVVARPSLSYCHNYSPPTDSRILALGLGGCVARLWAWRQLAGDQKKWGWSQSNGKSWN